MKLNDLSHYYQRVISTVLLVILGTYLLLTVISYSPYDPGWTHLSSDTQTVSNATGVAGAWIADVLYGFLGRAAILVPLLILFEAMQVWWPHQWVSRPVRVLLQGFIVLVVASLCSLHVYEPADTLRNAAGGILGYEVARHLLGALQGFGLTALWALVALTALLVGLLLLFVTVVYGIAWGKTADRVGALPGLLKQLFFPSHKNFQEFNATSLPAPSPITPAGQPESAAPSSLSEPLISTVSTPQPTVQLEESVRSIVLEDEHYNATQASGHLAVVDVSTPHLSQATESLADEVLPGSSLTDETLTHGSLANESLTSIPLAHIIHDIPAVVLSTTGPQTTDHTSTLPSEPDIFSQLEQLVTVPVVQPLPPLTMAIDEPPPINEPVPEEHAARVVSVKATSAEVTVEPVSVPKIVQHIALDAHELLPEMPLVAGDDIDDVDLDDFLPEGAAPVIQTVKLTDLPATENTTPKAATADPSKNLGSQAAQVAAHRKTLSVLPSVELLDLPDANRKPSYTPEELSRLSALLEIKLQEFNIKAKVIEVQPGPVVTRFEIELAPGIKASKLTGVSRDLARSISKASVRVVEVIPGKPYIGIDVPNTTRDMVRLIEILETPSFRDPKASLSMAMGKDIAGRPVLADLARAPHMLVAGTTGSGKSVAVNAMLLTMLLKYTPEQLRLILIDPKQLELANYNDIPHLLTPVVTDMKDAVNALNWCVNEMERRYALIKLIGGRKIDDFNQKVLDAEARGEALLDPLWRPDEHVSDRPPRLKPLPFIVIVADEFADLIMQVGKKAEELITRLTQKSRAAGIHLLLATQRPSVDVITGLIKANIPTRAALRVNSKIDSRTILDASGAEDMLGNGDMLFVAPGKNEPERVHGPFVSDDEVNRVCDAWRERGSPNYVDDILTPFDEEGGRTSHGGGGEEDSERDADYDLALAFFLETRKVSASSLQRKYSWGYNRAARVVDSLEAAGIISKPNNSGKRELLM